jgi:hypothetical protein
VARLEYATTFNSCWGFTLDRAIVDLTSPVFAHGQLYTALIHIRERCNRRVLFAFANLLGEIADTVKQWLYLKLLPGAERRLLSCNIENS